MKNMRQQSDQFQMVTVNILSQLTDQGLFDYKLSVCSGATMKFTGRRKRISGGISCLQCKLPGFANHKYH